VFVGELNWLGDVLPGNEGVAVEVKLRSASRPASARLYSDADGSGRVVLDTPQHGIARGQAAVFYAPGESTRVLGGGWITGTEERAEAA
jgi:tRNA-specific 2-thiouridylase